MICFIYICRWIVSQQGWSNKDFQADHTTEYTVLILSICHTVVVSDPDISRCSQATDTYSSVNLWVNILNDIRQQINQLSVIYRVTCKNVEHAKPWYHPERRYNGKGILGHNSLFCQLQSRLARNSGISLTDCCKNRKQRIERYHLLQLEARRAGSTTG